MSPTFVQKSNQFFIYFSKDVNCQQKVPLPPPPPSTGYREGFLWKRGRDNGQFLSRKFVLSEREGVLKYFNKNDVSVCGDS